MNVFLTGATGFMGGHVLTTLIYDGHSVGCLVRKAGTLPGHEQISEIVGDITNTDSFAPSLSEYDAIIHLIAVIKEKPPHVTFERLNANATIGLVKAAEQENVSRFIHMSALGADENGPTPYFQTKGRGEQAVLQSNLDYTIFRPSFVYGPGDEVYSMLARIIRYSPFGIMPVFGDGLYRHQPVSILNVARAVANALVSSQAIGKCYDLGGPEQSSYNDQLKAIAAAMGKKVRLLHVPGTISRWLAGAAGILPFSPIDSDRLTMLMRDNVCDPGPAMRDLELELLSFKDNLDYLYR